MSCENNQCNKSIYIASYCQYNCSSKFCSKNCLLEHQLSEHDNHFINRKSIENFSARESTLKSLYYKPGVYLKEYKNDPKYDYANFEYVKMGNNKYHLGSGAFGEAYLIKNKIDGNFYAVKQVYKIINLTILLSSY